MTNVVKMEEYLSIGELARQTGIGVHTLRVWEKRYGAPHSQRLPSGHRRYPKDEVPRLRAIARALESGYRAGKVVTSTLEELHQLLGVQHLIGSKQEQTESQSGLVSKELEIEKWIAAIHQYDEEPLSQSFFELWNKEGPLKFISDYAGPFIKRIGNGWAEGELTINQEHFATEILGDFLSSKWRQLNTRNDGPVVVLATLPEETHSLGLMMCAAVTSLAGFKAVYLGPSSPIEEIIKTAENSQARLLCLSISNCVDSSKTKEGLKRIRKALDDGVEMIVGGEGAMDAAPGIARLTNFNDYYEWIRQLDEQSD